MRTDKNLKTVRNIALAVMTLALGVLVYILISGAKTPDAVIRIAGIAVLVAMPVSVFAIVRLQMLKKEKTAA